MFLSEDIERLKEELTAAIESKDLDQLQKCIQKYEEKQVPDDDGQIMKAKQLVPLLQINDGKWAVV